MDLNNYIMPTYKRFPVTFVKGEGVYLYDDEGQKYLDFMAGIAVNSLGYSNSALKAKLHDQIDALLHTSNYYFNDKTLSVAAKISQKANMEQAFFCNSGTESIEAGLKLAYKRGQLLHADKTQIVVMKRSFHGRTLGSLSATSSATYRANFPIFSNFIFTEMNDENALREVVNDNTCLILLEPIQGEGGVHCASEAFVRLAKKLSDDHNALLMFDEVQTGAFRCGSFLASSRYGVQADLVAMAKGLAAGISMGVLLAAEKAKDGLQSGEHGTTFGGNPLALAAMEAVLEEGERLDLETHVTAMGDYLVDGLNALKQKNTCITAIRGQGLLIGMDLDVRRVKASDVSLQLFKKNVLLITAGENTLRFIPPLVIQKENIDTMLAELQDALQLLCE